MKALSQKRRHPLAAVVLLALALILTGGLYTVATATNQAKAESNHAYTQQDVEAGQKLFQANCATCHGTNAEGTADGPSLIGVGAASRSVPVVCPCRCRARRHRLNQASSTRSRPGSSLHMLLHLGLGQLSPRQRTLIPPKVMLPMGHVSFLPTAQCATTQQALVGH